MTTVEAQSFSGAVEIVLNHYTENYSSADTILLDEKAFIFEENAIYRAFNIQYYNSYIQVDSTLKCKDDNRCELFFNSIKDNLDLTILHNKHMNIPDHIIITSDHTTNSATRIVISPLIKWDNKDNYSIWIQNRSNADNGVNYNLAWRNRKWEINSELAYYSFNFNVNKNYIREVE